ncbi:MAG TPA: hypothetical protein VK866_16775 [Acidimicrobiales bacterium]|nr:hypothetical protein [Acidimicrobiales bacterium]
MGTHLFLTEEWRNAVRTVKERHEGGRLDTPGLVVNATITDVPFGDGSLRLHSEHGPVIGWETGHADHADVAFEVDYATARQLVLDESFDVLEQAIGAGALRIEGDRAAFRDWWRARIANPDAVRLDADVRSITS